jgi:hypothetical protein
MTCTVIYLWSGELIKVDQAEALYGKKHWTAVRTSPQYHPLLHRFSYSNHSWGHTPLPHRPGGCRTYSQSVNYLEKSFAPNAPGRLLGPECPHSMGRNDDVQFCSASTGYSQFVAVLCCIVCPTALIAERITSGLSSGWILEGPVDLSTMQAIFAAGA